MKEIEYKQVFECKMCGEILYISDIIKNTNKSDLLKILLGIKKNETGAQILFPDQKHVILHECHNNNNIGIATLIGYQFEEKIYESKEDK